MHGKVLPQGICIANIKGVSQLVWELWSISLWVLTPTPMTGWQHIKLFWTSSGELKIIPLKICLHWLLKCTISIICDQGHTYKSGTNCCKLSSEPCYTPLTNPICNKVPWQSCIKSTGDHCWNLTFLRWPDPNLDRGIGKVDTELKDAGVW